MDSPVRCPCWDYIGYAPPAAEHFSGSAERTHANGLLPFFSVVHYEDPALSRPIGPQHLIDLFQRNLNPLQPRMNRQRQPVTSPGLPPLAQVRIRMPHPRHRAENAAAFVPTPIGNLQWTA